MARTRGASYHEDGELLDKDGKPIPTERAEAIVYAEALAIEPRDDDPPQVLPAGDDHPVVPAPTRYRCDASTWDRNMEAWEAMRLLNVLMGGELKGELDDEEWSRLPADVRRHWRRVAA